MKNLRFYLFAFVCCCMYALRAQTMEPNLKFGEPTKEELTMTEYAPDKDAEAVVLCQTTRVWYDFMVSDFKLFTEVKTRLKVLKPEGVDCANVKVVYYENENLRTSREVITGLKAFAYNMENGKLVKTKMENVSVSRERIDKSRMLLKFSVPQVREGTVIEYQYRKESDFYYNIDTWYAQESIPVAYASYELTIPEYFRFNVEQSGNSIMENTNDQVSVSLGGGTRCTGSKYKFVARQLPAMKDDDFVFCVRDFYNKVSAELRGIEVPGSIYKDFTDSWEHIAQQLLDDDDFGHRVKHTCPIKDLVPASGASSKTDVKEKVAAIAGELRKRLKWNGSYALYGNPASKVIKDGTGSNADLNFILLSAFAEAGLEAHPVVMSHRQRGRLPITHPSIDRLNTFVVGVVDGEKIHYVDASAEDGYVDVLPPSLLPGQALMLCGDGVVKNIDLQSLDGAKQNTSIECTLAADGHMEGQYVSQLIGHAASSARQSFRAAQDSVSFVNKEAEEAGVSIDSYQMDGRNDYSPKVTVRYHFSKAFDATADHIYLKPLVISLIDDNPFKSERRLLPVEFPYKHLINTNVVIHLPEGYSVEEKPQPLILKTDDNGANFRINYVAQGQDLLVQCRMAVNKMFFASNEYEYLRKVFDAVQQKTDEMLVLKKD